ncbi:hypothetical protein HOD08_00045 [bacterium]|nr:hypothetical protein [bacterium]
MSAQTQSDQKKIDPKQLKSNEKTNGIRSMLLAMSEFAIDDTDLRE